MNDAITLTRAESEGLAWLAERQRWVSHEVTRYAEREFGLLINGMRAISSGAFARTQPFRQRFMPACLTEFKYLGLHKTVVDNSWGDFERILSKALAGSSEAWPTGLPRFARKGW